MNVVFYKTAVFHRYLGFDIVSQLLVLPFISLM